LGSDLKRIGGVKAVQFSSIPAPDFAGREPDTLPYG
jgi:hypothetical protein